MGCIVCHVLIIEDETLVAMHLEALLSDCGATSFDFAETEIEAITAARRTTPGLITSDVRLRDGLGPRAVAVILEELGPLPVIFITATPENCVPCDAPSRIFSKPLHEPSIAQAFRSMAFVS